MKAAALFAAVVGARLACACAAWAQLPVASPPPVPSRLEIAGTVGAVWLTPTMGLLVSVPAFQRVAIEGGVNATPHELMTQGQLRVPLRRRPGARRSLVFGLTHLSPRTARGVLGEGLSAHAGMSAQAPLTPRIDLRADLQMIMALGGGPDASPRAFAAVVWHR